MGSVRQNSKPLVSIIIPIYKVQDYLDNCIESVVNQTYENIEIILVDDGSPDRCGMICDRWASCDPRILTLHKENGGLSDARNFGLSHAHGDYIVFVDSDDLIEPELIEDALLAATSHHAQIVVYQFRFLYPNNDLIPDPGSGSFPHGQLCDKREALEYLWQNRVQNFSWSIFAESSIYDGIRFPKGRLVEDMATTYKLFNSAHSIFFLGKSLVRYRVRNDSILSNINKKVIADMANNISEIDTFATIYHPDLVKTERNWAIRNMTTDYLWLYQIRATLSKREYRELQQALTRQLNQEISYIGWGAVSKHNLLKVMAIKMKLMPIFARISTLRSGRASSH